MPRPKKHWTSVSSGQVEGPAHTQLFVHNHVPVKVVTGADESVTPYIPEYAKGGWTWVPDGKYINLPIEHKTVSQKVFDAALAKYQRDYQPDPGSLTAGR